MSSRKGNQPAAKAGNDAAHKQPGAKKSSYILPVCGRRLPPRRTQGFLRLGLLRGG